MSQYVEIRRSLVASEENSKIVPVKEFSKTLNNLKQGHEQVSFYRSMFAYPESVIAYKKNKGNLTGYKEKVDAGYLLFDIDCKDDLEKAKKDTRTTLNKLLKATKLKPEEFTQYVELFFSGNKGFHLVLKTVQRFTPDEMKSLCMKIADGISTIDAAIYNTTRIIRIENTVNDKTGLYKIPLDPKEFAKLSIAQIQEMAKTPVLIKRDAKARFDFIHYKELLVTPKKAPVVVDVAETVDGIRGIETVDFSKCPKNMPLCFFALSKGLMVPGQGERHYIFLTLARYWKNQGMDADQVHNQLKATSRMNKKLYPEHDEYSKERIWHECVKSVFEDEDKHFKAGGWGLNPKTDTVFKKYCDIFSKYSTRPCVMHSGNNQKDTYTIDELADDYAEFSLTYEQSIIKTGVKFIDEEMEIMKGTVTLMVGAAGSGKTTFALKLLQNASAMEIPSVMFSMDMNKRPLFEKLFLKHTKLSKIEARELAKHNPEKYREQVKKIVSKYYKHVTFVTKGTMTSDEMKQKVMEVSEQRGHVGLVLVDYAGRITSGKSDSYANDKHNALRAPEIASDTDAAWVYLNQVGRNHGDSHVPLRTKRAAKGAGDWEEAAQNVITLWRPFADLHDVVYEGDTNGEEVIFRDDIMRCYTAKNRMGISREVILGFNGKDVFEGTNDEIEEYKQNRQHHEKYAYKHKSGGKSFGSD